MRWKMKGLHIEKDGEFAFLNDTFFDRWDKYYTLQSWQLSVFPNVHNKIVMFM